MKLKDCLFSFNIIPAGLPPVWRSLYKNEMLLGEVLACLPCRQAGGRQVHFVLV